MCWAPSAKVSENGSLEMAKLLLEFGAEKLGRDLAQDQKDPRGSGLLGFTFSKMRTFRM